MRLELNAQHPEPRKIRQAVDALRRGEAIAYPTDTVYGLGVDVSQRKAIDRLYQIKRMPRDQPLAFLCADLSDISRYAVVENDAYRLMKRLTPGPYVFILQATREVPRVLMMKRKNVGIRVPDHPVPRALLAELGGPIVSTSATTDGEILNDPADVDARFPGLAMVLDAGSGGLESSTVLDLSSGAIEVVREGAGPIDSIT